MFGIAVGVLLAAFPFLVNQSSYIVSIGVKILMYAMLASALNVVNGYTGQLNIGMAAFYAIGSYTAALLATKAGISFWLLLLISGLVTAFFGLLVSLPTRRLGGTYLALVTLGLSEIVRLIIQNWNAVTNGPMGVKDIPRASFFGHTIKSATDFYYLGLVLTAITVFVIYRVVHSNVGRSWISIREDVTASKFLGVNVNSMKSLAFMFSGFFAGIAGCYCSFYYQYISPDMFKTDESFSVMAMVIIGGQGTILGPVIGSVAVNVLNELMRAATEFRQVAYGLLIILMMWLRPAGIAGDSSSFQAVRLTRKKPARRIAAKEETL
ncbi:MAG: branched-chain amino acid ABC transporter permease [Faecousia sp.]